MIYSGMTTVERWQYRVLLSFGIAFTTAFFLFWFQPIHIARNFKGFWHIFDYVLFICVSYVVWYQIINELFSWYVAGFMKKPPKVSSLGNYRVAFLTAFVPGSEPYAMLKKTGKAMKDADYPHDTWILDEGNDPNVISICKKYGLKHFSRKGIEKYNSTVGPYLAKTKGGNYNAWFDKYGNNYDLVAQLDVDFIPRKDFLTKIIGFFNDPHVAFVGTPQIYGNTADSWIVRGAAEQAYNFYGTMQKGLHGMGMSLFIGANHVIRVSAHDDIEGYSGHIVEDHLTGMRFYANKWKSIYLPEVLAVGEGPSTWGAYFSQQMRWAYGLIDILFRHSPSIFRSMRLLHTFNYFLLQQYYFYGIAQAIGVFLLCLYFIFGISMIEIPLLPLLSLYIPLILIQQLFFLWSHRFNINPKQERGFMWRAKLLNWAVWPIYFLALLGVIQNKRLTYAVTPKGKQKTNVNEGLMFIPHFILGTLTAICLICAIVFNRSSPLLIFWACVNTIFMYGFSVVPLLKYINNKKNKMKLNLPSIRLKKQLSI